MVTAKLYVDGRELTITADERIVLRKEQPDGISMLLDSRDSFELRYFYPHDGGGGTVVAEGDALGYIYPYIKVNRDVEA